MPVSYNPYLVIVSAFIAVFASYTALDLAGRVTTARGAERQIWLVVGATAMGTGIWSMHFLAMLAFSLPVSIGYNFFLTIISLLAAILASALALSIVSRPRVSFSVLVNSAVAMGIGVGLMHYIGMAAMQMAANIHYNPILFLLSVVVAVVVSLVALKLSLQFRDRKAGRIPQIISAIVMGAGIVTLHYTGMAAATFKADPERYFEASGLNRNSMAFLIASFTFLILSTAIVIATDKADNKKFLSKG